MNDNPFRYDNRGHDPSRPWPKAKRRARWPRIVLVLIVVALGYGLYVGQADCVDTLGPNARACHD